MNFILILSLLIFAYFSALYLISVLREDFSLIDLGWGPGFLIPACLHFVHNSRFNARNQIIFGLLSLWATRLAYYLYKRSLKRGEDFRYKKMREGYGDKANFRAFTNIFMLQAVLLLLCSSGIPVAMNNLHPLSLFDYAGIIIFLSGLCIEAVADYQVQIHKNENRPSFVKTGLWKYSRHPNYFGEALLWWSLPFFAQNIWALGTPILMTLLLRFVSGVPLLEAKYKENLDYQLYSHRTNAFIPWFQKREQ